MSLEGAHKKGLNLTSGNWLTIGVFIVSGIMAWAKIEMHINDATLHIGENEVVLTVEEYKNLLNFATTINNKAPLIDKNHDKLREIEIGDAVHFSEYEALFKEHEDLETKVSRIYKELKDEIHQNYD